MAVEENPFAEVQGGEITPVIEDGVQTQPVAETVDPCRAILKQLLEDLEGAVHMSNAEVRAIIDRARFQYYDVK
jgi:hypothetical protein